MSNLDPGPLARYNSLQDKHLAGYFSNTKMKKHLIKAGLVKKNGEIVDDNMYRLKMAKKEHQKHVKDLLATAIVHKALDVERMRQYEFRKKLDELYKIELVQRVRGEKKRKGDEEIVPLLLPKGNRRSKSHPGPAESFMGSSGSSSNSGDGDSPLNDSLPEILYDPHKQRLFTKRAPSQDRAERMAEEDRVPYHRSYTHPHPPQKKKQTKRKTPRGLILARTETTVAHRIQLQSLAEVMLKFTGPNLNLTNDMFLNHKLHEIMVLQQHCGGSTLCVFREQLPANTTFSFISRRHRGAPFGLTLYIDGVQDLRVSSCCEYKHRPGSMLGGKNAKFLFLGVNGAAPCYKCQAAFSVAEETRSTKRKSSKSSSKKNEELSADADKEKNEHRSPAVKINVRNQEEDDVFEEGNKESEKRPVLEETGVANAELPTKTDKLTQTGEDLSANSDSEKKESETEEKDVINNDYDDEDFENDDVEEQDKKEEDIEKEDIEKEDIDKEDIDKEDIEKEERNYESDFGSSPSSSSGSEDEEDKGGKNRRKRKRTKKRANQEVERDVASVNDKPESDDSDDSTCRKEDKKEEDKEKEDIDKGDREKEDSEMIDKEEGAMEEKDIEEEGKDDEHKEKGTLLQSGAVDDSTSQASENEIEAKEDTDDIDEDRNEVDKSSADAVGTEKVEVVGTDNDEHVGEDRTSDSVHDSDGTEKDEDISNTEQLKETDNEDKSQDIRTRETPDDQNMEETEAAENVADEAEKASGNQEEGDGAVVDEDKQEENVEGPNSSQEEDRAEEDADEGKVGNEKLEDEVENGRADLKNEVKLNDNEQNDDVDHGADAEVTGKSEVIGEDDNAKEDTEENEENIDDGQETQEADSEKKSDVDEVEAEDRAAEAAGEAGGHLEEESVKEENDSSDNTNREEEVVSDAHPKVVEDEESLGNKDEESLGNKGEAEVEGNEHEAKSDVENAEGENPVEQGNDSSAVENSEEKNEFPENEESANAHADTNVVGREGEQEDAEHTADKENDKEYDQEYDQEAQDGNEEDVGGEDTVLNSEEAKDDASEKLNNDEEQTPVVFDPNEELSNIEQEKDPEAALFDSGRDPDGVADESKDRNDTPVEPQPIIKHEGSISLLIDSTSDVELSSVALSPNQVEEISEVVSKNPVDSFSLRNAEMDDESVAKVKEALENSGNLKMLNLNLNKIGPSGAGHLADVVKNNSNLKMLMLHGNEIGDEGIGYIVDALLENANINTLDVGDCNIGDQGAFRIAELLEKNNSITDLNISGNQISAKGWSAISDGIKKNSTVTTLSLDFSDLKDEGTEIVCEGIRDNSSLKSIDFEGNRIGDIGGRRILAAVKNNTQIMDVTLMPENDISPELQEEIKSILVARAG